MIGQLKVLLRVKTLKEEQALRALQAKRRQVEEGRAAEQRARAVEEASRATLGSREDAIYDGIIGKIVSPEALDDTRSAVVTLEQDHARLTDATERAVHVLARLNTELDSSSAAFRFAAKVKDKYTLVLGDACEKADAAASLAEENEVEELFGGRRKELS